MRKIARLTRRLRGDEHGTVLVIVAGCMVLFLSAGAYTIDLGSGRQAETKAQSAADASAEAAADAIENGTSATTAADTIAQDNGIPSSQVLVTYPYNGSSSEVKVVVNSSAGMTLAGNHGVNSLAVSASAIAAVNTTVTTTTGTATNTYTSTTTIPTTQTVTSTSTGTVTSESCPSAGGKCMAIFAMGTSCGGDSSDGNDPVVIGGGVTISGGVWSNGSINLGGGGSTFGPLTYANGCSISPSSYQQNSSHFNNGYPTAASPQTTWPLNYAADFPQCSGSGCTGPCANGDSSCASTEHTPSFCTKASNASSWSVNSYTPATLFSDQIYCAVGSGSKVKPNNPATWTGALTTEGAGSDTSYVAASITVEGGSTFSACGYSVSGFNSSGCSAPAPIATPNYPLFYATTGTVDESNGGGSTYTGDWFVPDGTISVDGGTNFIGFLEAQVVDLSGGITGDGPIDDGSTYGSTSTTTSTSTSVSTGSTTSLSSATSTTVTSGSSTSTNGSKLVG
jgi:Flp pilus assembly protein TadG